MNRQIELGLSPKVLENKRFFIFKCAAIKTPTNDAFCHPTWTTKTNMFSELYQMSFFVAPQFNRFYNTLPRCILHSSRNQEDADEFRARLFNFQSRVKRASYELSVWLHSDNDCVINKMVHDLRYEILLPTNKTFQ